MLTQWSVQKATGLLNKGLLVEKHCKIRIKLNFLVFPSLHGIEVTTE